MSGGEPAARAAGAAVADAGRCPLCGGANACALAARDASATAPPCWCVAAVLDATVLARAAAVDGGAACVCAACAGR